MTPVLVMAAPRLAAEQSAPVLLRKVTVQPAGTVLPEPKVEVCEATRSNESATVLVLFTYRTKVVLVPGFVELVTRAEAPGPAPVPSTPGPPRAAVLVKSTVLAVMLFNFSVTVSVAPALSTPTAVEVAVAVAVMFEPVAPAGSVAFTITV